MNPISNATMIFCGTALIASPLIHHLVLMGHLTKIVAQGNRGSVNIDRLPTPVLCMLVAVGFGMVIVGALSARRKA
jgi:hypothetical protein